MFIMRYGLTGLNRENWLAYSIIWCCLPGCHPPSILAAYATVPSEVQSTRLNEYMLYKQQKAQRFPGHL